MMPLIAALAAALVLLDGSPSPAPPFRPEVYRGGPRPALSPATTPSGAEDDTIEVTVRGTLRTGVMAIGGESTGVTIAARGVTWELDFRGKPDLAASAERLDGRRVEVKGTLEVRPGVERRQRSIVTVRSLRALGASAR